MRPRSRSFRLAALLSGLALVTAACAGAPEDGAGAPVPTSRAVTFRTADDVELSGRLFGADTATTGIVFAHMLPADQSSWFEFAARAADEGYLGLTFGFRGSCPGGAAGCSQGQRDVSASVADLEAAVAFLRSAGVQTVALVGASVGGTAALIVAAQQGDGVAAVLTLSAPQQVESLMAGPDVIARITAAKLFVAGLGDGAAAASAQTFADEGPAPKRLEIVTSDDHGTDLLSGNQAEIVRMLLLSHLAQYAPA